MIPKLLVLSAGGYGAKLQTGWLNSNGNIYQKKEFYLVDDYKDYHQVANEYKDAGILNVSEGFYGSSSYYTHLIPCYNIKNINRVYRKELPYDTSIRFKRNIYMAFRSHVIIPTFFVPEEFAMGPIIVKPNDGSGSKEIRHYNYHEENSPVNTVIQPYCPGDEIVVDCVKSERQILYTARRSIERENGRDTLISFNITEREQQRISYILSSFILDWYEGPFNIQLRYWNNELCIMEWDQRFSGSSIVSDSYGFLLEYYFKNVGTARTNGERVDDVIYEKSKFNKQSIEIYESFKITPPTVTE